LAKLYTKDGEKENVAPLPRTMLFHKLFGYRDGAVVRALASHQCGPGSIPRSGVMWVEFVGSLLCTKRFSPGTLVSPLLKNQNLS